MSKKKHDVMEEERKNFIYGLDDEKGNVIVPGCVRNGISEQVANTIFNQMMDFASYAFNKAHAAAYAVIGYQTAYLMRYYPAEFTAAMLNSQKATTPEPVYMQCQIHRITSIWLLLKKKACSVALGQS